MTVLITHVYHRCVHHAYLDSSAVGDSLVRVDALVQLLAVEELTEKLLNMCG